MAVNLVKPDPGEDDEVLADVVELHLVDDEGAADTSRLRAFMGGVRARIEAEGKKDPEAGRALVVTRPRVRTYFDVRGGGKAVRVGSIVMVRAIRKRAGKTADETPAEPAAAAEGAQPAVPAGGGAGKPFPKKGAKAKAKERKIDWGAAAGVAGFGLLGLGFLLQNLDRVLLLVVILIVIWVPVSWLVGGFVLAGERPEGVEVEDQDDVDEVEDEGLEEVEEPADADASSGETGERGALSHEEVTQKLYAWLRGHIGEHPGVHLQTLVDDLNKTAGEGRFTIPHVQNLLGAHGIAWKSQQKGPDWAKGGKITNRAGVAAKAVPESYTPVQDPGSALVRLLPPYQAPDLQ